MSDTDQKQEKTVDLASDPRNPENLNKTTKERVADLVSVYGCPLEELFRIGMDLDEEATTRLRALKEAAEYAYPKRKSVEVSGPDGQALESKMDITKLSDTELDQIMKIAEKAIT